MRASEICKALRFGNIGHLGTTKNGSVRMVPLSTRAIELYGDGFDLTPAQIDSTFRAMTAEAKIEDLHFHDSRREAIIRLSKKMDVLDLARVVGHKNLNELLTYYQRDAADLAKLLEE